ncbi:MAG: FAD-binding protein [Pseudomonadota bacterium]
MLAPDTEELLAEAIASAETPLSICGGTTQGISTDGNPLSTANLSGIVLYDPGALTLIAKAGTPVAEIEEALAAEKQLLAFEPMDYRTLLGTEGTPTIGGVVASNSSGSRRVQAGACRDYLLGVRFVDGEGSIIKNGGRVMKNVTGYDVARLMCGAYGTLGVLTEVGFKVLPASETTSTLVYHDLDWSETAAAFAAAMSSPFEVSGAARLPTGAFETQHACVLIRLSGFTDSVAYRCRKLSDLLETVVGRPPEQILSGPEVNDGLWKKVRDVEAFAGMDADIWHISMRLTELSKLKPLGKLDDFVFDWAGGRVWAKVAPGTDVRALLAPFEGHATLVKGGTNLPRFHPETEVLAKMAGALRSKYDPKGILNPRLMG